MSGETRPIEGHCLCGAVRVRMTPPVPHVEACHCTMCRRWGGGAYLSLRGVPDPEIEGAEQIVRYASSDWAERGFCGKCGTHLFYRFKGAGHYSIAAGLLDREIAFDLKAEFFIDSKPPYYSFANSAHQFTGAEARALYAPVQPPTDQD